MNDDNIILKSFEENWILITNDVENKIVLSEKESVWRYNK